INFSSLQVKVLVIVAVAMGTAMAVSVGALTQVYASIKDLDRISREDFTTQTTILLAMSDFKGQAQAWKNVLVRGKVADEMRKQWTAFEKAERETVDRLKEARSSTPHDKVRAKIEESIATHKAAGEVYRKAYETYKAANMDVAAGDQVAVGADRKVFAVMEEAERAAQDMGAQTTSAAVRSADRAYYVAIAGTVVAMLIALVVLFFFIRRAVLSPISTAVRFSERLAEGDLTADIRASTQDETGHLLSMLGRMKESLAGVVAQVRSSAESVVTASSQVSAGQTDLSQRTEEQASSLEETAASMEELASTVKQNADNARQADELARNASKRAEQGGAEVVRVVATMTEISDSAKKITDIVSVIDSIAFQTNILALNAAVEAARAGEQGRGFAVVAAEVRSLAQRSAQAAKEIKDLIGNSVEKVESGTQLVEQAGDTIQALVIDVKRVSELMASIAEASAEQARGVQQVNKTVTEMDKVVQQNASAVQQSSAAAEGMRQQAESLARAVGTFRLTAEDRVREAPTLTAQHSEPASRAPAIRAARAMPIRAKASQPVAAGAAGDDWEEF
ncbi:MAG TPA: methyl-accepting chemotaxis protein, partial [Usitatibacter sp.]|nr:methyl-accepting chemotaxis protein [Usitatibacter sp.]